MWDGTGWDKEMIWVGWEEEIFLRMGLDRGISHSNKSPGKRCNSTESFTVSMN